MKASKVGLLILILGFGGTVETAWQVRQHAGGIGASGCRALRGKFYGPSFSFDASETRPVAAGAAIEVENGFGGVRVSAGAPGQVGIALRKVVYQPTEEEARKFAERIRLQVTEGPGGVRISTNRSELDSHRGFEVGFETHLEITVPSDTPLKVTNAHGRVDVADVARADLTNSYEPLRVERVAGPVVIKARHGDVLAAALKGTLDVTNRHGDVELRDVEGAVKVELQHGDLAAARVLSLNVTGSHGEARVDTVRGDLELEGRHYGIEARDVTGRAVVDTGYQSVSLARVGGETRVVTQHAGVDLQDLAGPVFAKASYGDVEMARISGPVDVTVSHGSVKGEGLEKGARVRASGEEVALDGFRGAVEIDVERGGVRLIPGGPLTDPVRVSTNHGAISLDVPAGSQFELQATSQRGEVSADVPGLEAARRERRSVAGKLGAGGSLVILTTERGDVRIRPAALVAEKR